MLSIRSVCVFCGSSSGTNPVYAEAARRTGAAIAAAGLDLVTGAGHVGLMGVVADAALAAGGRVIGVIPTALVERELAHERLSELHVVETMHQRKALMADKSGAFVALPGGYGTLDELFEILTWAQLGIHHKPIGLLNVAGYFDPLLEWVTRAVSEGFLRDKHRQRLITSNEVGELLDAIQHANPAQTPKWIGGDER